MLQSVQIGGKLHVQQQQQAVQQILTPGHIEYFTGVQVSHSSQQRLVHCQNFDLLVQEDIVEELSVDAGNIRLIRKT